jgi:hypothetical protein
MMVRKYQKSDYNEITTWFHDRKIAIEEGFLPEHGFIWPGVAAGFIYKTDSNFCLFENFIGNPQVTKEQREEALVKIVSSMIDKARELGFERIYGFATSQGMIRRGAEQGFKFLETCSIIEKVL